MRDFLEQNIQDLVCGKLLVLGISATFVLDITFFQAAIANHDAMGNTHQFHICEHAAEAGIEATTRAEAIEPERLLALARALAAGGGA